VTNIFYTPSGNPATGADGLSALVRGEFLAVAAGFDQMPQIKTTGVFTTTFVQQGNFTFTLPASSGALALASDVTNETARAEGVEALLAPKASPVFTVGATLSYTLPVLDNSNEAVSSKWVANFLAASGFAPAGLSPVITVATRTGNVTLVHTDITDWTATINAALAPYALAASIPPLLRGQLSGLALSNDIPTPLTLLDIAAGSATDSTSASVIILPGTITKSIAGGWVAGSAAGGMGTGLAALASTWYHVYAATIAGNPDVFFDTAFPPTHAPVGTTASRRIGSIYVGAAVTIAPFIQSGDSFQWIGTPADMNLVTLPTLSRTLYTLYVPAGVRTTVTFRAQGFCAGAALAVDFTSPDCSDQAIAVVADLTASSSDLNASRFSVRTNTASQIGIRALNANTTLSLGTIGWTDSRGRD